MNSNLSALVAARTKAPSHPVLLGVAVVAEVALKVIALVTLSRTPRERVRMGVRWPWAVIIVLVNTIGSVVFLVLGRKPAPVDPGDGLVDDEL